MREWCESDEMEYDVYVTKCYTDPGEWLQIGTACTIDSGEILLELKAAALPITNESAVRLVPHAIENWRLAMAEGIPNEDEKEDPDVKAYLRFLREREIVPKKP